MQGFVSFTIENVSLTVINAKITSTCPGSLCNGRYGIDRCPCVTVSHLSRQVIGFQLSMKRKETNGTMSDLSARLGLKLPEFMSLELTNMLVNSADLEVCIITTRLTLESIKKCIYMNR